MKEKNHRRHDKNKERRKLFSSGIRNEKQKK
jgi:hypothetical protein